MKKWISVLIYMLALQAPAQGLKTELLEAMDPSLSPKETQLLLNAQLRIERLLPPVMKERLFQFRPAKGFRLKVSESQNHFAGSSNRGGEIFVNRIYLNDTSLLTKTLLHEWAHQYDFINYHPDHIKSQIAWCQSMQHEERMTNLIVDCDLSSRITSTVSATPEFQEIAGWSLLLNGKGQRSKSTSFALRWADIYEQKSPGEMFAVNMEHFLMDAEYQCRRPSLHRYLSQHFNYLPFAPQSCSDFMKIVDPAFSNPQKALVSIDPKRLYQVHYLLAEGGDSLSSKFGHAMFRLVMCSPKRSVVGPECLKDIQHHIVLSYRASVDTPEVSTIAGLNGSYRSRLFFIPLSQVLEEYNKTELRDLESYPLNLSQEEITRFLERSIETHWAYDGQYYFLSNNCAVESLNLLRSSLLRDDLMTATAQTPYGLKDILVKNQILNEAPLKDRAGAVENAYLFLSHEEHLNKALEVLSSYTSQNQNTSIQSWLNLGSEKRRELFMAHLPQERQSQVKYAAAFLLLESQAQRREESSFQTSILKILSSPNLPQAVQEAVQQIMALKNGFLENKGHLTTPAQMLETGYGLPSPREHITMQKKLESIAATKTQSTAILNDLYKKIYQPEQLQGLKSIQENKTLYNRTILGR